MHLATLTQNQALGNNHCEKETESLDVAHNININMNIDMNINMYINMNININIIIIIIIIVIIIKNLNSNSSYVGWCLPLTLTIPPAQFWARDERCIESL